MGFFPKKDVGLEMRYFVLSPSKRNPYGKASRKALLMYAEVIEIINPKLASDLKRWVNKIKKNIKVK